MTPEREAAIAQIVAMMRSGLIDGAGRFSRDEMHER
jgi:hypothetical protein